MGVCSKCGGSPGDTLCPECLAEDVERQTKKLEGENKRLQHMMNVLKFQIAMLYKRSRDIENDFRVVDGRVQVCDFLDGWTDLEEAREQMERELEGQEND